VDAHLNTGRPVLVENESAYDFQRLPAFYQIDVRAERRFLLDRVTLNLYVELVNATLTRGVVSISASRWTTKVVRSRTASASSSHRSASTASSGRQRQRRRGTI
jgi:hypothetical protein